jgi:hypothetical protein
VKNKKQVTNFLMKTLIFSSVGDHPLATESLVNSTREQEFDLAIAFYGNKAADKRLISAARWFRQMRGGKFQNFAKFMADEPHALQQYDYVFIPDDDIRFDAKMLRRLIAATQHYNLNVSSFSHCWSGKPSAIKQMMQADHQSGMMISNFVEMGFPLFKSDVINSFLAAFRPIADQLTGWGTDFVFASSCWSPEKPFGIYHGEAVRNAFDCERSDQVREIERIQSARDRERAWEKIANRFSINHRSQIEVKAPEPKIYCIHLRRATERAKEIQSTWVQQHGMRIEWVDAVDRREIDIARAPIPYYPARARHAIGREMTDGEIACATSHVRAMKRALEFCGPEGAVIMEDDSRPLEDGHTLFQRIKECRAQFPELQVIKCDDPYNEYAAGQQGDRCMKVRKAPWGTALTWFSHNGLQDAIKQLETMAIPADWPLRTFAQRGVLGMLNPGVAVHPGETSYLCHSYPGQKREFKP